MSIGTNIKRLREIKGLTQEQLAEQLDVTFQAVSSWERDEYRPEFDTFLKLTKILDVPSTSIIEDIRWDTCN
jgi:GTP pyrophosphokinase